MSGKYQNDREPQSLVVSDLGLELGVFAAASHMNVRYAHRAGTAQRPLLRLWRSDGMRDSHA